MNNPDQRISPSRLREFCIEAMSHCGMREADAGVTADVLVTTDTWGIFTHGTIALRKYMDRMRAGGLVAQAVPEVVREGPGWALVDGHSAIGMVSGCMGMQTAIAKAKTTGIGYVGIRNSSQFGAAGYYANLAAQQDLIGLSMTNGDPNMTVPGAKGRVISCIALAFAVPAGNRRPILFDVALSAAAAGKVIQAESKGEKIPDHWLVDSEGVPTTDPS